MLRFTNMEVVGVIPHFLSENDSRPAVEQIDAGYQHGGGWRDFEGFELEGGNGKPYTLAYPGDPLQLELSRATLRDETLVLFTSSWFAVIQEDGSHRIARID